MVNNNGCRSRSTGIHSNGLILDDNQFDIPNEVNEVEFQNIESDSENKYAGLVCFHIFHDFNTHTLNRCGFQHAHFSTLLTNV